MNGQAAKLDAICAVLVRTVNLLDQAECCLIVDVQAQER
eukprot:COSAG04_NODE_5837_length_1478_cov_1.725888_1_plen_38_part_10